MSGADAASGMGPRPPLSYRLCPEGKAGDDLFSGSGPQPKQCLQVSYGRDGRLPVVTVDSDGAGQEVIELGLIDNGKFSVRSCKAPPESSVCNLDMASLNEWTNALYTPRFGYPGLLTAEGPDVVRSKSKEALVRWIANPGERDGEEPKVVVATLVTVMRDSEAGTKAWGDVATLLNQIWKRGDTQNKFWDKVQWGEARALLAEGFQKRLRSASNKIDSNMDKIGTNEQKAQLLDHGAPDYQAKYDSLKAANDDLKAENNSLTIIDKALKDAARNMGKILACMSDDTCRLGPVITDATAAYPSQSPYQPVSVYKRPTRALLHPIAQPNIVPPSAVGVPHDNHVGAFKTWMIKKGTAEFIECLRDAACAHAAMDALMQSEDPRVMGRMMRLCWKDPRCLGILKSMGPDFQDVLCPMRASLSELSCPDSSENGGSQP